MESLLSEPSGIGTRARKSQGVDRQCPSCQRRDHEHCMFKARYPPNSGQCCCGGQPTGQTAVSSPGERVPDKPPSKESRALDDALEKWLQTDRQIKAGKIPRRTVKGPQAADWKTTVARRKLRRRWAEQ